MGGNIVTAGAVRNLIGKDLRENRKNGKGVKSAKFAQQHFAALKSWIFFSTDRRSLHLNVAPHRGPKPASQTFEFSPNPIPQQWLRITTTLSILIESNLYN